jgi:choline kinase
MEPTLTPAAVSNYVIFAAGTGSRLHAELPKFLVDVDGSGVFVHQLRQLSSFAGCVAIVCGYRAELVCQRVCEFVDSTTDFRPQLSFVYNPRYLQSQVTSIHCALNTVSLDRPTFLIDGDMLFAQQTIDQLHQQSGTAVAVRADISRDAVIANTEHGLLRRFERNGRGTSEWANIAKYDPADLSLLLELSRDDHVPHHFELLNELIAAQRSVRVLQAAVAEIDQCEDLPAAIDFVRNLP